MRKGANHIPPLIVRGGEFVSVVRGPSRQGEPANQLRTQSATESAAAVLRVRPGKSSAPDRRTRTPKARRRGPAPPTPKSGAISPSPAGHRTLHGSPRLPNLPSSFRLPILRPTNHRTAIPHILNRGFRPRREKYSCPKIILDVRLIPVTLRSLTPTATVVLAKVARRPGRKGY